MNWTLIQEAAAGNRWDAILPEIGLGVTALFLLLVDALLPGRARLVAAVTAAGLACSLLMLVLAPEAEPGTVLFSGLVGQGGDVQFFRILLVLASLLVCYIAGVVLPRHPAPRAEFHHVLLVTTAALMLLVQSRHFVLFFVALETAAVGFYVLVAYFRHSSLSLEAGLKVLVAGSLNSAILLFGIVLLYGAAGSPALPGATGSPLHFAALQGFLAANPGNPAACIGVVFVLAGVAFKIGAVPFQLWIPDVYQGAPTPVTAFLATSSKIAGFAVLLNLVHGVFSPVRGLVEPVLTFFAAASILFGSLAALTQHNVKRLLGLSGISHAGYLLMGVVATLRLPGDTWVAGAVCFYLLAYLLGTMAVFGVMAHLAADDADQDIVQYSGLSRRNPLLAGVLGVGLGSLAGIPPLAGFMAKLLLFVAAFKAGMHMLVAVALCGVVLSIYYYFAWIRAAFFSLWRPPVDEGEHVAQLHPRITLASALLLGVLALTSVILGFIPGPLGVWVAFH